MKKTQKKSTPLASKIPLPRPRMPSCVSSASCCGAGSAARSCCSPGSNGCRTPEMRQWRWEDHFLGSRFVLAKNGLVSGLNIDVFFAVVCKNNNSWMVYLGLKTPKKAERHPSIDPKNDQVEPETPEPLAVRVPLVPRAELEGENVKPLCWQRN